MIGKNDGFKKGIIKIALASSLIISVPSGALAANGDIWKGNDNIGNIGNIVLGNKSELFGLIKSTYRYGYEVDGNVYNAYDANNEFKKNPNSSITTVHSNIKKSIKAERPVEGGQVKDFDTRFNEARMQYYKARNSRVPEDAHLALEKARLLEACEASDMLEYECRILLDNIGEIKLSNDEKYLVDVYREFCNILDGKGFDVTDTKTDTIAQAIKTKLGNSIVVSVTKISENSKGEEVFNVVLTKGSASTYPISVIFK